MRCLIERAAALFPDAPAVIESNGKAGSRVFSFARLHAEANATAERLIALGVCKGDRVVIALKPSAEYLALLSAIFRIGAVASPISPKWPDNAVADYETRLNARWSFGVKNSTQATSLDIREIAALDAFPKEQRDWEIDSDAPAIIVSSSGSTGTPKLVVQSYGNHCFCAEASNRNISLKTGDKWLLALSLHHVAGLGVMFRCFSAGAAVFIAAEDESIQESILRGGTTHVSLVATQLLRLLDSEDGKTALCKLQAILVGGGPVPEALIRESARLSFRLFTTYGMSEMASQITTSRPGDNIDRLLTSGAPIVPNSVRIEPDGEICVRSSALFWGYLTGNILDRPLTEDGWFRTGDLGQLDADGYLTVFGRKDNMFVCGGENIHPEEIERHLCRLPGVRAALAVPMADAEFGMIPVAFVEMNEYIKLDIDSLLLAISQELPRHKTPRRIFPWPKDLASQDVKINRKKFIARICDFIAE